MSIDTGAQVNLVKKGLISEGLMQLAAERLCLRTANGQGLDGGEKSLEVQLGFQPYLQGEPVSTLDWLPATFFEADIHVDAIISHPWLKQHRLGVFPHLGALASLEAGFYLLGGVSKANRRKMSRARYPFFHKNPHFVSYSGPDGSVGDTNVDQTGGGRSVFRHYA